MTYAPPFPRWSHALYWFVLLVSLHGFAELAYDVGTDAGLPFDPTVLAWFRAQQTPGLTYLASALGVLAGTYVLGPVTLLVLLGLARRSRHDAWFFGLSVGGALALNLLTKVTFARARPTLFEHLSAAPGYSFPSGHAMVSAAFFLALLLLFWRSGAGGWARAWIAFTCLVAVLAVGASRLYLQVHFPSDVLAGWAFSAAWVLGLYSRYLKLSSR